VSREPAPGAGDDGYLDAAEVACELTDAFDPAEVDPIGGLSVSTEAFASLGSLLAALDRPTVLLQEGGYALDRLGDLAVSALAAWSPRGR